MKKFSNYIVIIMLLLVVAFSSIGCSQLPSEPETDPEQTPSTLTNTLITNVRNSTKVNQNFEGKTIFIQQKGYNNSSPYFTFCNENNVLKGLSWVVKGEINTQTVAGQSGHIWFICKNNAFNVANITTNCR